MSTAPPITRRLLVPLDGTPFSEFALQYAARLLDEHTEIELVTVMDVVPATAYGPADEPAREAIRYYHDQIQNRLSELPGTVTSTILKGSPGLAISHHAWNRDVAAVVMSTHGRGPMSRVWLGSVADTVVRHAEVPVLLVRPDDDGRAPRLEGSKPPSRVLVALDGSEVAEEIIDALDALGLPEESELHLVRAVQPFVFVASVYLPNTIHESKDWLERQLTGAKTYLANLSIRLERENWRCTWEVPVEEQPARALVRLAEEWDAELIALTTHGHSGLTRMALGSVADKVVRSAKQPVLVFRPPKKPEVSTRKDVAAKETQTV